MYATAKNPMILYGMGVCQFDQAVDVVKGLAGLALMTGNCRALKLLEDESGKIQMNPQDAKELDIKDGEQVSGDVP